jgi:ribonuclease HI
MKEVDIYTDGSCLGNPGAGGWCSILMYKGKKKMIKGGKENTTNNEMELTAVLEALKKLKEPCKVNLYTDSQYIANAINSWIHNWSKHNWLIGEKKNIKHLDKWKEIYNLMKIHDVKAIWVKGHSGNFYNELCDKYAREEAKKFKRDRK